MQAMTYFRKSGRRELGLVALALCVLALPVARAQDNSSPRPDQLEPGVNTSATPATSSAPAGNAGGRAGNGGNAVGPANAAGADKAAAAGPASAPTGDAARTGNTHRKSARAKSHAGAESTSGAESTAGAESTGGAGAEPKVGGSSIAQGAPKAGARTGKAQDRIELDTTQITGNRELPKVLYIVPWKRSDLGDLVGKPVNTLLDEVLEPVDRDVFKRENRYYDALKPDQTRSGTVTVEGSGDKR